MRARRTRETKSSDFIVAGGNGAPATPIDRVHLLNTMNADFYKGWKQDKLESLIQYSSARSRPGNDKLPCMHPDLSDAEQAKIDKLRATRARLTRCPLPPVGGRRTRPRRRSRPTSRPGCQRHDGRRQLEAAMDNVGVARYEVQRSVGSGSTGTVVATSVTTVYRDTMRFPAPRTATRCGPWTRPATPAPTAARLRSRRRKARRRHRIRRRRAPPRISARLP